MSEEEPSPSLRDIFFYVGGIIVGSGFTLFILKLGGWLW